ncbi:hypothetical protein [Dyadobacter sandarakinus]|uniref:hypothetical protein n=1 Tax=Dyadobacter sandarakinus TaxID=2747268 RepID=UPI001E440998|nr:hypothetical protein [Dyadobacter sandarakinus]
MTVKFTFNPKIMRSLIFSANLLAAGFLAGFTVQDSSQKPDESRFTPVVVADNLDEPMVLKC